LRSNTPGTDGAPEDAAGLLWAVDVDGNWTKASDPLASIWTGFPSEEEIEDAAKAIGWRRLEPFGEQFDRYRCDVFEGPDRDTFHMTFWLGDDGYSVLARGAPAFLRLLAEFAPLLAQEKAA
jgi:hypothetical protein